MAGRPKNEAITKTDKLVAERIRRYRNDRGYTQEALARALGLSYQQVQKYEIGGNRVSIGKLYEIAKFLGVPIEAFFEGMEDAEAKPVLETDPEIQRLHGNFQNIDERNVRAAIAGLVKSLRQ